MIFRDVLTRPALLVGSLIVVSFLLAAWFAPVIAPPVDPSAPQYIPRYGISPIPKPPGPGHPLGLLPGQYDVFYGLIWGSRIALGLGMIIALGRALIGVTIGLLAGTYSRLLDAILMRIADAFMAFPMVAAIVVMLALFGYASEHWVSDWSIFHLSRQNQILILAMVMFGWVPYARLIRGNVLAERERTYIKAARSIGVPRWRLIWRHLFPNSTYGLIALITSDIGAAIVLVTAFTFIGIFIEEHGVMQAEWGLMLSTSRDWIVGAPGEAFKFWYTYLPVSLAIVLFSTGWSLVGDGLRDVLDPRMRGAMAPRKSFGQFPSKIKASIQLITGANPHPPQTLVETHPIRVSLNDQDAFTRLELLAERQGASEALPLKPDERRQTPPDWVQTTGVNTPPPGDSQFMLMQGRLALEHSDIPQALSYYTQLIRSGQMILEVIQDLSRAHKDFPADIGTLQALGDAHLRLDHFQQAMEAYALAEKLLS